MKDSEQSPMILYSAKTFSLAFESFCWLYAKQKESGEFITEILNSLVSRTCTFRYCIIKHMIPSFVCRTFVASSAKWDVRSDFIICTTTKGVVDSCGQVSVLGRVFYETHRLLFYEMLLWNKKVQCPNLYTKSSRDL